jgi:hypothetical protein
MTRYSLKARRRNDSVEAKIRLNKAFVEMRKQGLLARQSFMCCRNCAGCELANLLEKMTAEKRAQCKGACFYTKQDGFENDGEGTYLAFGNVDTTKFGEIGEPTVKVGERVVAILKAVGLSVEWDGTEGQRIWVSSEVPEPPPPPKVSPLDRVDAALGG